MVQQSGLHWLARGPSPLRSTIFIAESTDSVYPRLCWALGTLPHMRRHHQKNPPPLTEAQFPLPLGLLESGNAYPSQNLERSKAKRLQRLQGRLATNPATHEQHGIVQGSFVLSSDKNKKEQRQRKALTSLFLTYITEVNENRWTPDGSALPPFSRFSLAFAGEGRAHVRRGSS
jgi:hypothetical protein